MVGRNDKVTAMATIMSVLPTSTLFGNNSYNPSGADVIASLKTDRA